MFRPKKKEVIKALEDLKNIRVPDGDNEGMALNSSEIYDELSPDIQNKVDNAVNTLYEYTRTYSGEINQRSITELNKVGYKTSLEPSQNDPYANCGKIIIGENIILDISDDSKF